jgi:type II secretory pathway pseudopilin PulG
MALRRSTVAGFTLVEVVIVIAITSCLIVMVLPAAMWVQRRAQHQAAASVVAAIKAACESYRDLDRWHRLPIATSDRTIRMLPDGGVPGVAQCLVDADLLVLPESRRGSTGELLDPWRRPYRYATRRPVEAAGEPSLVSWNWDARLMQPAAWGSGIDPTSGARWTGELPFPHVWSEGDDGVSTVPRSWIVAR